MISLDETLRKIKKIDILPTFPDIVDGIINIIEDPMTAVARGAGMVLENLDDFHEVLIETEELQAPK